ncbi:GNAT family N-acetyltransferase [Arthrobacter echini]|uniref:GNAT family N-acetyltransferase n=1 Tax=Arthrobacter echini TaxID=1529066 RepID=UPI00145603D1|nr:GNAT family N-acetyltransferase [Arthrobacter echini]
MLIRAAPPHDGEQVRNISTASGRDSWNPSVLVVAPGRLVVVAEVAGELVGAAKTHFHGRPDGDVPAGRYLGGVMVTPAHRRQGVAFALTQARLEWIYSYTDCAYYFANEHNTASIRLHEQFCFHPLGSFAEIHGVTADNGRSKLILFKASRG